MSVKGYHRIKIGGSYRLGVWLECLPRGGREYVIGVAEALYGPGDRIHYPWKERLQMDRAQMKRLSIAIQEVLNIERR